MLGLGRRLGGVRMLIMRAGAEGDRLYIMGRDSVNFYGHIVF